MLDFPFRHPLTVPAKSYAVEMPPDPELLLDCTMGVNPYGYPSAAAESLKNIDLNHLQDYPHDTSLTEGVINHWKEQASLSEKMLFFSDGSVSAIYCLNNLFAQSIRDEVVGFYPTFTDMVESARRYGMTYRGVSIDLQGTGHAEAKELLPLLSDKTAFIYVDRPNNPTGQTMPLSDVEMLCQSARDAGAYCVIDEAYGDFIPREESAISLMGRWDNLIVIRTFSKGFGLANLRAGYLVLQPELVSMLKQCSNPYVLSDIQRRACAAALTEPDYPASHGEDFSETKKQISQVIGKRIRMLETDGRVPICTLVIQEDGDLQKLLMDEGIYTLSGLDFDGLNERYVRLCAPVMESVPRLIKALERLESK